MNEKRPASSTLVLPAAFASEKFEHVSYETSMPRLDRAAGVVVAILSWLPTLAILVYFPWLLFPNAYIIRASLLLQMVLSLLLMRRSRLRVLLGVQEAWYHGGYIASVRWAITFMKDLACWIPFAWLRDRFSQPEPAAVIVAIGCVLGWVGYGATIFFVCTNPLWAFGDALYTLTGILPEDCLKSLGWTPSCFQVLWFDLRHCVSFMMPWYSLYTVMGCSESKDKVGKEEVMRRNGVPTPRTYSCCDAQEMVALNLEPDTPLIVKPNLGAAGADIFGCTASKAGRVPEEILSLMAPGVDYLVQKRVVGKLDARTHSFRASTVRVGGRDAELLYVELLMAVNGECQSNTAFSRNRLLYARGCDVPPPLPEDDIVTEAVREAVRSGEVARMAEIAVHAHNDDPYLRSAILLAWDFAITADGAVYFEFNMPCYLNEVFRRMQAPQLAPLWNFWHGELEEEMTWRIDKGVFGLSTAAMVRPKLVKLLAA